MRIHIQNAENDPAFAVTAAMFADTGHVLSFGETEAAFQSGLADAEALVTATGSLAKFYPCPAPRLKLIFCTSAGLDRLAPFDWLPPHVALLNNRGVHATRAGEYAAMALLMLAGHMPEFRDSQSAGRWERRHPAALRGRHLAVLGTGDLGAAAGRQGRHFGMRTTGIRTSATPHPDFDRVIASADLDALLPDTEFLLLAAPLTPATRGMLTRARLESLPKGAFVINIGRGALLDQDALCDRLDGGDLGGAVLDVFTPEPIPPGHRLWTTRNLIITPHISADDPATYASDSVRIFLANLAAFQAGQPMPNRFDTARGY
jgi:phosphoglycerate dehydrogenase-like enzyme